MRDLEYIDADGIAFIAGIVGMSPEAIMQLIATGELLSYKTADGKIHVTDQEVKRYIERTKSVTKSHSLGQLRSQPRIATLFLTCISCDKEQAIDDDMIDMRDRLEAIFNESCNYCGLPFAHKDRVIARVRIERI